MDKKEDQMTDNEAEAETSSKENIDNLARLAGHVPKDKLSSQLLGAVREGKALSDVMDKRLTELRAENDPDDT